MYRRNLELDLVVKQRTYTINTLPALIKNNCILIKLSHDNACTACGKIVRNKTLNNFPIITIRKA
jgi:hypothetical protein